MKKDNDGCANCGRPLSGLTDMTMVLMQVLSSSNGRPINCAPCELAIRAKEKCKQH